MRDQPTRADGSPAVDLDALAAALTACVERRAAEALIRGLQWTDDEPNGSPPLYELQQVRLVEAMLDAYDGTRAEITHELEHAIPEPLRWVFHDDPSVRAVVALKPKPRTKRDGR